MARELNYFLFLFASTSAVFIISCVCGQMSLNRFCVCLVDISVGVIRCLNTDECISLVARSIGPMDVR